MDSENSGSLHTSSGDEEYNSRANSISAAFVTTRHHHQHHHPNDIAPRQYIDPISNNSQQPPPPIFDPLSNYLDAIRQAPQNPNSSLLNLETTWSKTLRFNPNSTDFNPNPLMVSGSSIQSIFASNQQPPPVSVPQPVLENSNATNTPTQAPSDQNNQTRVVRNSKKRSRASRRAPTTVLTTDTTNFRAMVQEFTGIPSPSFTSSPFSRARFDLFAISPSSMRSNDPIDSSQLTAPPYLHRLFPQKVQTFLGSPNSTTSSNNISSLNGCQIPPLSANIFNLPNPVLTSLLQSSNLKSSQGLDEFSLSQGHVNPSSLTGLPGLISSNQKTAARNDNIPVDWESTGVVRMNSGGDRDHEDRSVNGNFSLSRINSAGNGRLNCSGGSLSGFHREKGSSENVADAPPTRGEGMMESWISSSDLK